MTSKNAKRPMPPSQSMQSAVNEFLTSRRARLSPKEVGLRPGGKGRRVPGLRREEVAALAGVSLDYYTRLERGRLQGASDSVLSGIADALRLDDVERAYLLALAHGGEGSTTSPELPPSTKAVLAHVKAPALAITAAQDIAGANLLGRALFDAVYREYPDQEHPNMARFAFIGESAQEFYGTHWGEAQVLIAAMLRMQAAQHPANTDLAAVITGLLEASDRFRMAWERHDVHEHRSGTKTYHHPVVGDLPMTYDVFNLPGVTGLSITVYGPQPGTDAEERIAALACWAHEQDFAATGDFPSLPTAASL